MSLYNTPNNSIDPEFKKLTIYVISVISFNVRSHQYILLSKFVELLFIIILFKKNQIKMISFIDFVIQIFKPILRLVSATFIKFLSGRIIKYSYVLYVVIFKFKNSPIIKVTLILIFLKKRKLLLHYFGYIFF